MALQEAATFIQLPGAGKKPGVPVSVLAVFIGAAGITFLSFLGNCGP